MNATQWKKRLVAGVFACAFLPAAYAAAPAANTVIGNQASASYTDAAGNSFTATSNLVTSTVQQVYSFTLDASQTKQAVQGQFVSFPHTLKNTGNGADSYQLTADNSAQVFRDENGNGVIDVGDVELKSADRVALAANQQIALIVRAQAGSASSSVVLTATPVAAGQTPKTNTDNITLTLGGVLSVTKSANKASVEPGGTVIYTLTYSNSGNAAIEDAYLEDVLDARLTYVNGSGLSNASVVTDLSDGAEAGTAGGVDYQYVAGTKTIKVKVDTIPAGGSGTVKFSVTVGQAAATLPNSASFCPDFTSACPAATPAQKTNTVQVKVNQTASVVANGDPNGNNDPAATDTVTLASAAQGATLTFDNYVFNKGNGVDQFNITIDAGNFPVGTSFQLYKSDGVTPLIDTNGDGIPDTGDVAADPNQPYKVVVKAQLPKNAVDQAADFSSTMKAASVFDSNQFNIVTNVLKDIAASTVDITNGGSIGAGSASTNGGAPFTTKTVAAGAVATFVLEVKNTSPVGVADTYSLGAFNDAAGTVTFAKAGWSVAFFEDAGTACSALGAQVSDTGNINGGDTKKYCARVTTAAGEAPGNTDVYFQVKSSLTGASDTKLDRVTIAASNKLSLTPNGVQQVFPGGIAVYSHTLKNVGNVSETVSLSKTDSNTAGFSSTIYVDTNNNGVLDASDPVYTGTFNITGNQPNEIKPNQSLKLLVRVESQSNVAAGTSNLTTLTAQNAGNTATVSATDTTNVVAGFVKLTKSADKDALCDNTGDNTGAAEVKPGECIIYTVTAINNGSALAKGVQIADTVPAFTSFAVASCLPASACVGVTATNIKTAAVDLQPGQTVVLTFRVKVAE